MGRVRVRVRVWVRGWVRVRSRVRVRVRVRIRTIAMAMYRYECNVGDGHVKLGVARSAPCIDWLGLTLPLTLAPSLALTIQPGRRYLG